MPIASEEDPNGNPLSPNHPWNKETIPRPEATNWKEKYSWSTAPRWDRMAMETGPYSRMWANALAEDYSHLKFIEPTGKSLKLNMPKSALPAAEVEWMVPTENWGAFERNRARAHAILYTALIAYENLLIGLDMMRKGETAVSTPYKVPKDFQSGRRVLGSRARVPHAPPCDGQGRDRELPDPHSLDLDGLAEGSVRKSGSV